MAKRKGWGSGERARARAATATAGRQGAAAGWGRAGPPGGDALRSHWALAALMSMSCAIQKGWMKPLHRPLRKSSAASLWDCWSVPDLTRICEGVNRREESAEIAVPSRKQTGWSCVLSSSNDSALSEVVCLFPSKMISARFPTEHAPGARARATCQRRARAVRVCAAASPARVRVGSRRESRRGAGGVSARARLAVYDAMKSMHAISHARAISRPEVVLHSASA